MIFFRSFEQHNLSSGLKPSDDSLEKRRNRPKIFDSHPYPRWISGDKSIERWKKGQVRAWRESDASQHVHASTRQAYQLNSCWRRFILWSEMKIFYVADPNYHRIPWCRLKDRRTTQQLAVEQAMMNICCLLCERCPSKGLSYGSNIVGRFQTVEMTFLGKCASCRRNEW